MRWVRRSALVAALLTLVAVAAGFSFFGCSQTPTSVPIRTFERAQRMDTVCVRVFSDPTAVQRVQPVGLRPEECVPVPSDTNGTFYDRQLFGLVTQASRGEVAVVALSAGQLIDTSRAIPGINFLPVGANPTDITATPDGRMVFVASAEPNKPAIYGIPSRRILGDTPGFPRQPDAISLASWPVCTLPQNPGAITVVPRTTPANADAGAAPAAGPEYDLVVVLPGDRRNSAKIVTIDPRPFRRGGLIFAPDAEPDYAQGATFDPTLAAGDFLRPGVPVPCNVTSAVELVGETAVPTSLPPAQKWDDGVKYVEGGVDTTCQLPAGSSACAAGACCDGGVKTVLPEGGVQSPGLADAGAVVVPDAAVACDPNARDAGPLELDLGPLDPPRLVSLARDGQTIYVADEGVPLIHVVDLSTPNAPRELPPYVAASHTDPSRIVQIRDIALSPPTREYQRFLYAVDRAEGSIIVYDATNPQTSSRTPLVRPHPELNPFKPVDRILFGDAPVVAVSFARTELPLGQLGNGRITTSPSGVLCNPNRNLDGNPAADLGFFYRANSPDPIVALGPRRLRGIYAFATLSNGRVMVIDVDDWDSPCRRPQHLAPLSDLETTGTPPVPRFPDQFPLANADGPYPPESIIALPQPFLPDTDPYHAPHASPGSVTNEAFFPMTAPHTPRSDVLVKEDSTTGANQLPRIVTAPQAYFNSVLLPPSGPGSENTPIIKSRIAFDVTDVHRADDWSITYEGSVPGFQGVSAKISAPPDYSTLTLSQTQASFCGKGIEDFGTGRERALKIEEELAAKRLLLAEPLSTRMSDYIQLDEELLDPADPYWALQLASDDPAQCWDPRYNTPQTRYDVCRATFGTVADNSPLRDFPILEAYTDHLVVGRYYTSPGAKTREVVGADRANAELLRLARCCFHHQVRFKVRAGSEWIATSLVPGTQGEGQFFHHVSPGPGGRCVLSCDPREALLSGRVPGVPFAAELSGDGRDSPLVMRNPMFAIAIGNPPSGVIPARDTVWGFQMRGDFRPLAILYGGTSTAVSPQSMKFIEPLGQIGVVDGASQGLVLIDLRGVTVARAPYF